MKKVICFLLTISSLFYSCKEKTKKSTYIKKKVIDSAIVYTPKSKLENEYLNFNSPEAINRIADIENEYFNDYRLNSSKYYGTQWYYSVGLSKDLLDSINVFQKYALEKK